MLACCPASSAGQKDKDDKYDREFKKVMTEPGFGSRSG
jgi:hypothetical protein